MNEFISISSNSCITGIGWTCKTIRTSIIPRVITSFAVVSHVLPPVLSSMHTSFACSQSISTLTSLIEKVCNSTMCEVKRNRRSTKSLSSFLAFLYIAIKHTGLAIHREHSKQSMIMHLSDSHVRGNIYFTTKEKNRSMLLAAKGVPFENIKRVSSC